MNNYLFTSESVSAGHPDKICDQISDALVDAVLGADKGGLFYARAAFETMIKGELNDDRSIKLQSVILAGEGRMVEGANINAEEIARRVINKVGYDNPAFGFDGNTCEVIDYLGRQSGDIAKGVDKEIGAGDQGLMFGYACNETDSHMPLPIHLAHQLIRRHDELRRSGGFPWLMPDAKSQVSVRYQNGQPVGVETVVFSTQHSADITLEEVRAQVAQEIIAPIIDGETKNHINPAGEFVIGGPAADCGLTGRKIIVDTYGGAAPHGGGAFSGKDPTKVDRSAAYALRHIAKNIVAAGVAEKCLIQAAYAIGEPQPVSIMVDTKGTGDDAKLSAFVQQEIDLTPKGIITRLNLWRPIYAISAAYGHFGRTAENGFFPWEALDLVDTIRNKFA